MRSFFVGIVGLAATILISAPLCVQVRSTGDAGDAAGSESKGSAELDGAAAAEDAWVPKRLRGPSIDLATTEAAPRSDLVAFLPMQNRGRHRIHPTFLRAVDTSLAAHASIVDGRHVVSPDRVAAILRAQGQDEWFAQPSHFRYVDRQLARFHQATGAGVVVWAELAEDGSITLESREMIPGADATPWRAVRIEGGEDLDRLVYEAPSALLAELARSDPSADPDPSGTTAPPIPEADLEDLAVALADVGRGEPASFVRAESRLSELAARHPEWPDPWVELAVLRVARPLLFEPYAIHAVMNEGPNPARHLALLMKGLSAEQRARLDFVDHFYIGHRRSNAELEAMISALPAASIERALLALFHSTRAVERFGLAPIEGRGVVGQILFELASQPGPAARRAFALDRLRARDPLAVATPILLSHARVQYDLVGDWTGEEFAWKIGSLFAIGQALETLRETCEALSDAESSVCLGELHAFIDEFAPDTARSEVAPDGSDRWSAAAGELMARFMAGWVPTQPVHPIPEDVLAAPVAEFAGHWYATHRLVQTANGILGRHDLDAETIDDPSELIASLPRDRVMRSVDWMLMAAYQPAVRGMHRSRRDEYEPYADALRTISQQYGLDMAFRLRRDLDTRLRRKIPHALALNSLGSRHPYHPDYLPSYSKGLNANESKGLARWLEVVVPMPSALRGHVMRLRLEAGERDAVASELEASLAIRSNAILALAMDSALRSEPSDPRRALAVLDAAISDFPYDEDLLERSAWAALDADVLEVAEARFSTLSRNEWDLLEACGGLAEVSRRRAELPIAEKILQGCADRARSRWESHALMIRVASMQRDEGRFADSLASIEQAESGVGSSSAVLAGRASSLALEGRLDEAAAAWKSHWRTYRSGGSWSGAAALIELELARDRTDQAAEIFNELYEDERKHGPQLLELGRMIALKRDDPAGFVKLCRETGDRGLLPLAKFQWEILRDFDSAIATLDEAEKVWPRWADIPLLRGRILLARGLAEEALAESRKSIALEDSVDARRLEIESALAGGRIREVEQSLRDRMRSDRWSVRVWEQRARLEIARNETEAARETLAWATRGLRSAGTDGERGWWIAIRPLLLLDSTLLGRAGDASDDERLEGLLAEATKRLPNDTELWHALARVREHLREADDARVAWSTLSKIWPQHPAIPKGDLVPASPEGRSISL